MRFVLFIALACALPVRADDTPTMEEKAAIDAINRLGGTGSIDSKLPADARVVAKFEAATDVMLASLKKYPHIGGIDVFDATHFGEKGLTALKDLPGLRKLVLGKAALTPNGLAAIGQYKELRHLGLVNCGVTDASLAGLKKLTRLDHLSISDNPKITDKGMLTVKEFSRLQVLYLGNTSVGDKGLMELKGLDGLRTLSVVGTKITPDAAEKFADDMPNLRTVRR
jgi:hypothetical protein